MRERAGQNLGAGLSKNRAGVEDPFGVKRLFDCTHGGEFGGVGVAFEVFDLEAADAVFGAEGAAQGVDDIVHRGLDLALAGGVGGLGLALGRVDVVVQVAVAQVAETVDPVGADGLDGGAGAGDGRNMNMPLAIGTGDEGWLDAIRYAMAAIRDHKADALVLPLGFDASEHEPLAALKVTAEGFARAGGMIGGLKLPTAITQEGGYNVDIIGDLLEGFLKAWGDAA